MPLSQSVCSGIWLSKGSRNETKNQMGISHLIEHLVFKGTKKRTAYQLAKVMEERGGDLNAFTSKESICFYTTSLKKDITLSLDVLSDLVCHATFPKKEFDVEKNVILQEIAMGFDNHEEYIFELFSEQAYKNHAMGWSILGTENSINKISRSEVVEKYKEYFCARDIIVSVVGNVDHNEIVNLVKSKLGRMPKGRGVASKKNSPKYFPFSKNVYRDIEQSHVLIGFPAPGLKDSLRFASFIVNTALGGGMTSILYQKIREKKGLAYSVYSTISNTIDSGLFLIYVGSDPENKDLVIKIVKDELLRLKRDGFNKNLLKRYKTQIKGYLLINDDDPETKMNSLCLNEMIYGKYRDVQDILEAIEQVQVKDIQKFLNRYVVEKDFSILTIGP